MALIKAESEDVKTEEVKMAFIKEESEDVRIEEAFRVKHEDTDPLTGQINAPLEFRTSVMRGLLEEYGTTQCPPKASRSASDTPLRLTARHFPAKVPQTTAQGSRTRRHCKVCLSSSRKRKERRLTKYMCVPCNTPLCATPCFEEYHTLKNY